MASNASQIVAGSAGAALMRRVVVATSDIAQRPAISRPRGGAIAMAAMLGLLRMAAKMRSG
jgi:hypothetical protein